MLSKEDIAAIGQLFKPIQDTLDQHTEQLKEFDKNIIVKHFLFPNLLFDE